jgi:hypothetical protein
MGSARSLADDYRSVLLGTHEPPCLSLYQPTSRRHPENQQDPIRFRNLVRSAEQSLGEDTVRARQPLLARLNELANDREFWNRSLDGLAVLAAPDVFRIYRLQRPVPELAVVGESFHIKPLLRILQSADRYQILALSATEIRLLEGNRDALAEVELAEGVPRTLTEALGDELTEPHQTVASYGVRTGGGSAGGATPMRHGHGGKKDEVDIDAERFFRAVDRAILEHHSRPSGLPLLLAALPEHQSRFRSVSRNPSLMAASLDGSPDAVTIDTLRERAWKVVEPQYLARLAGLVDAFGAASSRGLGSDELSEVAKAAVEGRVATLLVDADRHVPGSLDRDSGAVAIADRADTEVDDLLDDLAEVVLRAGGEVIVVPAERMPTATGLAATYRY